MSADTPSTDRVCEVIAELWPARFEPGALDNHTLLGKGGAGLDSIEVAELLLVCEETTGVSMPESLLTEGMLTIARISDVFWASS